METLQIGWDSPIATTGDISNKLSIDARAGFKQVLFRHNDRPDLKRANPYDHTTIEIDKGSSILFRMCSSNVMPDSEISIWDENYEEILAMDTNNLGMSVTAVFTPKTSGKFVLLHDIEQGAYKIQDWVLQFVPTEM